MKRTQILETKDLVGQEVNLCGWIHNRRDHGKLIFIDLRDRSGIAQVVFTPNGVGYDLASQLRSEWVVRLKGRIKERPEKMFNDEIPTGRIEIEPVELEILNKSETPPFSIDTDGYEIGEESRMKYRYADLRRPRLARNLKIRHQTAQFVRNYLSERDFVEVETPILTKSTPEGARDFVVPSRLYPGNFFALPQSPQQYKQLLMVAGMERYFQFAKCFRDEDTRGDRQPEFTQLDMEMSFVDREDMMDMNEKLLIEMVKSVYPEKEIQEIPFPRLSYQEAIGKYQTDRPDIRKDKNNPNLLAFCWVVDFPFFERVAEGKEARPEPAEGEKDSGLTGSPQTSSEVWTFTHNPFSAPKPEFMEDLLSGKNIGNILTTQYDIVLNGWEIGGGSIRNHRSEALRSVFKIMGFDDKRIEQNFGHMLQALNYGAPPHGGIAWGFDRLVALLNNEPNIREVMAFPKTGDARDLMMESPSELEDKQLKELHLKTVK